MIVVLLLAAAAASAAEPPPQPAPPAGGLVQLPELIDGAPPAYPAALLGSNKNGSCVLLVDLDDEGLVQRIEVKNCDDAAFRDAAFAVMPHYTFIPAATATGTVPVRITWKADFVHPAPVAAKKEVPKPVRIDGRVREGGTGVVIPGADISCAGQAPTVSSDVRGKFALRGVADGPCALRVSAPGYHPEKRPITLRQNEAVTMTLFLTPTAANSMRTVIKGRAEEEHMTRRILDAEELGRVPGTMGDPIRAVERLPGVARTPFFGGGGLVVRGAEPQDTGYYLDGLPVPFLFHLGGGPSVIHPDFVDQLDFMPGGFGARYGRATAGIIDVRSRAAKGDRHSGKVDIDLMDSGLRLEGPVGDKKGLSYGLSARRSYIDVLLPIALGLVGGPDASVQPIYWDYQARLDYKKGKRRAGLRAYGADDVLVIAAADEEEQAKTGAFPGIGIHTGFHRLVADGRTKLGPQTELSGLAALGRTFTGGEVGDLINWSLVIQEMALRGDLVHNFSKALKWTNGIDLASQVYTTSSQFPAFGTVERSFPTRSFAEDPGLRSNREDDWGIGFGAHSTLRYKIKNKLSLLPGIRIDSYHWSDQMRASLDPRLQLRLSLAPKDRHLLKAAGGLYSQLPLPQELSETVGNPELKLKQAWQYGFGYEYRPDPFFHLDATLFYKKMFNLVTNNPDYVAGSALPLLINNEDGRSYGLELMLRHRVSPRPLYGWIAYTLSRSERYDRGRPEAGWTLFNLDQTHILSSVVGYKWGRGWSAGLTTRWVTGTPERPRLAARYDVDVQVYRTVRGDNLTTRKPAFFQTDFRIEHKKTRGRSAFTWYVDVLNLTNKQNLEFYIYQYDGRAYSGIAGVPFFPSLGIEWSW